MSKISWNVFIVAATSARIKARRKLALVIQRKPWKTAKRKPRVRKKHVQDQLKRKLSVKGKIEIKAEAGETEPAKGKKKAILLKIKEEPSEDPKKESPSTKDNGKKGQPEQKRPKNEVCF